MTREGSSGFAEPLPKNEFVFPNGFVAFSPNKFKVYERPVVSKELMKLFDELGLSRWRMYLEEADYVVLVEKGKLNVVTTCDEFWTFKKHGDFVLEIEDVPDENCLYASVCEIKPSPQGHGLLFIEAESTKILFVIS